MAASDGFPGQRPPVGSHRRDSRPASACQGRFYRYEIGIQSRDTQCEVFAHWTRICQSCFLAWFAWTEFQQAALKRIANECNRPDYEARLISILEAATAPLSNSA